MGFLSNLFKKRDTPDVSCSDEVLGAMRWSEDDEAWFGQFNGFQFGLAYEGEKRPSETLIAYAREILSDAKWLAASLAEAKQKAGQEFGDFYLIEIESLSFGRIHFYTYRSRKRTFAHLEGGKDYRLWRIEYADRHCEGIGFDS